MAKASSRIVQASDGDSDVLFSVADAVKAADFQSPKIKKILKSMSETLALQEDGVALAAPQIGIPLRIFVVKGSIFAKAGEDPTQIPDDVYINPVITKRSRDTEWMDEGCLSVKNYFGKAKRSSKATVRAYNEKGKLFERGASGLLAQIFQHETDHLNGILFTSHAIDVVEYLPKKASKKKSS